MTHRKTRNLYHSKLNYENLYKAWTKISQSGKGYRDTFEFSMFAHARVIKILEMLEEGKYRSDRLDCFVIFKPKPRLIMERSVKDKIVDYFVTNEYLIPTIERTLIDANVAARKKMGPDYAMKMLRRYLSQIIAKNPDSRIYALKIDISKYFYSIDHRILLEMLKKKIKDKDVIGVMRRLINETDKTYINKMIDEINEAYHENFLHYQSGKGLGADTMLMQFLAIFYLSDTDRFIKEKLHCKYYIRYMNSLLILDTDKVRLNEIRQKIIDELMRAKLLTDFKFGIRDCRSATGISFLGYRYNINQKGCIVVKCLSRTARCVRRRSFI